MTTLAPPPGLVGIFEAFDAEEPFPAVLLGPDTREIARLWLRRHPTVMLVGLWRNRAIRWTEAASPMVVRRASYGDWLCLGPDGFRVVPDERFVAIWTGEERCIQPLARRSA